MKPIDRLRQEYQRYKEVGIRDYFTLRAFCLDCNLVSFNEIELMEFEVDNEISV